MKIFFLYINTVKYLRFKQIFYRILRPLVRPSYPKKIKLTLLKDSKIWHSKNLYEEKISKSYFANFLNEKKKLDLPNDWNKKNEKKLWLYNLHYFNDLLAFNSESKKEFHIELMESWVDNNLIGKGVGWEPYPTSIRIINFLKFHLSGRKLSRKVTESIYIQAHHLSQDIEKHILANHIFTNLKALLFAGIVFDNKKWINKSSSALLFEIEEQVNDDGGNYELSPMYHNLMLVDMLDLFNLAKSFQNDFPISLENKISEKIPSMINFMKEMSHQNGVSHFNDSVEGIAPKNEIILDYANKLGFKETYDNRRIVDLKESGYFVSKNNNTKLIFDAAPIGPDYQPGHAHADSLSFELSINGSRTIVNSGISEYENSRKRLDQRKTFSHNTVEINKRDSSQVWSSFRVANRARIINRKAFEREEENILTATHDGYSTFLKKCFHTRTITHSRNDIIIKDNIYGHYEVAKSFIYFHPKMKVNLLDDLLTIQGPDFELSCNTIGLDTKLKDSLYYPEFGLEYPNKCLITCFNLSEVIHRFRVRYF